MSIYPSNTSNYNIVSSGTITMNGPSNLFNNTTQNYINSGITIPAYTTPYQPNSSLTLSGNIEFQNDRPIIRTKKFELNLDHIKETLDFIDNQYKIIHRDEELMDQNPSLRDAYDQYITSRDIEPKFKSNEYIEAYNTYKTLEALVRELK
jgi:hypothetical protein